jgi:6-phosphogluconolactonase (cycloisomerase 2 family)
MSACPKLAVGLAIAAVVGASVAAPATAAAPVSGASRALYVTNRNTGNIAAFAVDSDGRVIALGTPITTGTAPRGIALAPDGRAAYVVNSIARTVSAYAVDAAGALTPLGAPFQTGGMLNPFGVAMAPDGRTLYVISHDENTGENEGDGALLTFGIQPDGTLALLNSVVTGAVHPRSLAVAPSGRFLYIGHGDPNFLQPGAVSRFALGADGLPTPLGAAMPVGTSNGTLAITPDGRFLYVPCEGSGELFGFAIGGDGSLTPVPGSPLAQADKPIGTTVTPDGRYLYTVSLDNDTAYAYRIGPGGGLALAATHPTGSGPDALATSPNGGLLFIANFESHTLNVLRLGPDGTMTEAAGSPVPTGGEAPGFAGVAVRPNQGPLAAFTAAPARVTRFDASTSSDTDGHVARYDWNFGDGTVRTDAGPRPSHVYRSPGTFTVTLTVTDNENCATRTVYTGRNVVCRGSAAATVRHTVVVSPLDWRQA